MKISTHLLINTIYTTSFMGILAMPVLSWQVIAGILIGTMLPDIDNPHSLPGKIVPSLSRWLYDKGHRGFTHSYLFALLIGVLLGVPGLFLGFIPLAIATASSIKAHFLADMLTIDGAQVLYPYPRYFAFPPDDASRLETGSSTEKYFTMFLLGALLLIVLPIYMVGFNQLRYYITNSPNSVVSISEEELTKYKLYVEITGNWSDNQAPINDQFQIIGMANANKSIIVIDNNGDVFIASPVNAIASNTSIVMSKVKIINKEPAKLVYSTITIQNGFLDNNNIVKNSYVSAEIMVNSNSYFTKSVDTVQLPKGASVIKIKSKDANTTVYEMAYIKSDKLAPLLPFFVKQGRIMFTYWSK